MKQTIPILALVIGIVAGANILVGVLHREDKDTSTHTYLNEYKRSMRIDRPDIVLLGNSMLDKGVDSSLISKLLGLRCIKIAKGGSASAAWYLTLKNVIVQAEKKPRIVIVFFRDVFLTYPSYRVTGNYLSYIKDLSVGREPLLEELAYGQSPVERFMKKALPAYTHRKKVTDKLNSVIKADLAGAMTGRNEAEVDSNISELFADKNMDSKIVTAQQIDAETVEEAYLYDFELASSKSFLPEIIDMTKKENIRLIFVRVKKRRDIEPGQESAELIAYISDLRKYLTERDIPLIDFTHRPELKIKHYGKGDHLARPQGQNLFTRLLAEELKPLIGKDKAQ